MRRGYFRFRLRATMNTITAVMMTMTSTSP